MTVYEPNDLLMGATGTRCYFSPAEAREIARDLADLYRVPTPGLVFENPIPSDAHAVTMKQSTTGQCIVGFEDRGVPIEILAHELAHVIYYGENEDAHSHDDAFAILVCLVGWQIIQWLAENQWVDSVVAYRQLAGARSIQLLP